MYDVNKTLLPSTATDLAKALDILEERLFDLPVSLITKDPWAASEKMLDYLAWENSVDIWNPSWPEEIKRNVIAVAAEVHRYKGTPYAIKRAMSVFGVNVELIEWWHPNGSGVPGTFSVTAFVTDPHEGLPEFQVTSPILEMMNAVMAASAPVSRRWDFNLGFMAPSPAYLGVFPSTRIVAEAQPEIPPAPATFSATEYAVIPTTQIRAVAHPN